MSVRAQKALEDLQPVLDKAQEKIISEVTRLIADNELSAELALQKWHELNALHTLPKKVSQAVNRSRHSK